ncbi:hypothetical protein ACGFNP_45645 [Nonomuraea sp. NPDC049269]|uniref:hypothetical protein n=1 Tax=Nonomuraea sp. NPDC049269 TaxID=3364349 RepID=UPI003720EA93
MRDTQEADGRSTADGLMEVRRAIVVMMIARVGWLPDIAHLLVITDGPRARS